MLERLRARLLSTRGCGALARPAAPPARRLGVLLLSAPPRLPLEPLRRAQEWVEDGHPQIRCEVDNAAAPAPAPAAAVLAAAVVSRRGDAAAGGAAAGGDVGDGVDCEREGGVDKPAEEEVELVAAAGEGGEEQLCGGGGVRAVLLLQDAVVLVQQVEQLVQCLEQARGAGRRVGQQQRERLEEVGQLERSAYSQREV